ncbi:MAG: TonB-dependent receptor [Bacteroidales bacterium]
MSEPGNKIVYVLLFLILLSFRLTGQERLTQIVRGEIVDNILGSPLPGANILLVNSEPPLGTAADENGRFSISGVPVGRQRFKISFIGYQTLILDNIMVTSGKEVVLKVELAESITAVDGVEIVADYQKDQPLNSMALVSARSFTVEETNKYAGSYGDPARMAANYAGVVSSRDNRNDIIIRGNSPMGLQYRIDGIEVSNPNHYSAQGTTGGPVTLLNTNLLSNSDFLTGAVPAEFGNALSGVFDLKMRNGNNLKREYWAQLGWNGLEFGLEGPFSKKSQPSYLAAYRYSFVHVLYKLGINLPEVAAYQDLSFKLSFPTRKAGTFNLIGIGGASSIQIKDSDKDQRIGHFQPMVKI